MFALRPFFICLWLCLSTFSLVVALTVPWFFAESDQLIFLKMKSTEVLVLQLSQRASAEQLPPLSLEEGRITSCNKMGIHCGQGEVGLPFSAAAAAKTQFWNWSISQHSSYAVMLAEMMELWRQRPETAGNEVLLPGRSWCTRLDADHVMTVVYVEATKWILP